MTGEAISHVVGTMGPATFLVQLPHNRLVSQCGLGNHSRAELMTGSTGAGARGAEDKFAMGIHSRSLGDLRQRATMFRVTTGAGRVLSHHVAVPGHDGRRRMVLKIPC